MPRTHCPAVNVPDVELCDVTTLDPLITWLESGAAATAAMTFARGTVLPDGRLDLCKQSVGPLGAERVISAVQSNPHIKSILLGTGAIGANGARALGSFVAAGAGSVETLYLGCNRIAGDEIAPLTDALADNSSIKALWLKRNPLRRAGAEHIARLIENNDTIEVLDLFNAELGDDGVAVVARALVGDDTVRAIDVGGNGLGTSGCEALADALAKNTTLEDLRIAASSIGDDGARALARGLASNRHLGRLDIASCDIGPIGAEALFDALASHPSIELVDARRFPAARALDEPANHFGDAAADVAATMLAHAPGLRYLDLREAGITSRGALVLERALERRHDIAFLGFARYVSRRIRRRVRQLLDRNLAAGAQPVLEPGYVAAIRSVYR